MWFFSSNPLKVQGACIQTDLFGIWVQNFLFQTLRGRSSIHSKWATGSSFSVSFDSPYTSYSILIKLSAFQQTSLLQNELFIYLFLGFTEESWYMLEFEAVAALRPFTTSSEHFCCPLSSQSKFDSSSHRDCAFCCGFSPKSVFLLCFVIKVKLKFPCESFTWKAVSQLSAGLRRQLYYNIQHKDTNSFIWFCIRKRHCKWSKSNILVLACLVSGACNVS